MDGVTAQAESFLQGLETQAQQEATALVTDAPGLGISQDAVPAVPLDPAAAAMQLAAQQAAERFNQQFQAQQAQQPSEPFQGAGGEAVPSIPAANGSADYAQQPVQAFDQNGTQTSAAAAPPVAASADGAAAGRKRRNRWGPKEGEAPAPGQEPTAEATPEGGATPPPSEEPGKKKRRSRWEEPAPEPSMALATVGAGAFPKELVLPGGIKVIPDYHTSTTYMQTFD